MSYSHLVFALITALFVLRYLNMSLTAGSGIRKQDGDFVIASVAYNTVGRDLAFDFVRNNWNKLSE